MKDIKILIATHKQYFVPDDSIYYPVHVGKDANHNESDFQPDNTGDNISTKNPKFCELTGLYWAWKNLKADYIGLVHYRRYFKKSKRICLKEETKFKHVLNRAEVEELLEKSDIILPKKRRYFVENLYGHYKHTMYVEPLDETRKIIESKYSEYLSEFDRLKKRTSAHMFNMFIMKKEYFDEYCTWLFDILFELEGVMKEKEKEYDSFHLRYYGRVSELLLDVWINTKGYSYKECKVIDMQHINWLKKGTSFLRAKFFGKKYDKSF